MKTSLVLWLLFISSTTIGQSLTDTIHWRTTYKLKVEDFNAPIKINSEFAAVSNIGFKVTSRFTTDTSLSFKVYCIFYRNESWIKNKDNSSYILQHEQGHFDLAGIYRKKLQDSLNVLDRLHYIKNKTFIDKQERLIKEYVVKKLDSLDKQYDLETDFSRDHFQQNIWTNRIANMQIDTNAVICPASKD